MSNPDEAKFEKLKGVLRDLKSVAVAFSGGVDSGLLLSVAHEVLKDKAVAVTVSDPIYPDHEIEAAETFAGRIGVRFVKIRTDMIEFPEFVQNRKRRCYFCKTKLFGRLVNTAKNLGLSAVVHGENVDDVTDYRPGSKAAKELGVIAPLKQCGFTKADIRSLAKQRRLPFWDKPQMACLASRVPYGVPITRKAVKMVDQAETVLRDLGYRVYRVRHHGHVARIETHPDELSRLLEKDQRNEVVEKFRIIGYLHVALDLEGYGRGRMNRSILKT